MIDLNIVHTGHFTASIAIFFKSLAPTKAPRI